MSLLIGESPGTHSRLFHSSRSAVANMFSEAIKMGAKTLTLEAKEVGPLGSAACAGEMTYARGEYGFYDSDQKQIDIGK